MVMIIVMQMSLHFIPAPEDMAQKSLSTIFDLVPRIAVGSIIAYIIGQHVDVFIFLQLKGIHSDKTFIIRAYGSTMLSSIIDTKTVCHNCVCRNFTKYGCIRNIHYNLFIKTYFYYI